MKKYQRKLALMMATVLLICVIPVNAIATEEENTAINTQSTEGEINFTCGENAEWKLEEGITTIGDYAFFGCTNLV